MGEVTIDSIQIEIESNSTNASKGLDALAGSLEKLKKNGSFKTVSTNLNNLSTALYFFPLLLAKRAATYPKQSAAVVPPAAALSPPVNMPVIPFSSMASRTPLAILCPKPVSGVVAPAPANSAKG